MKPLAVKQKLSLGADPEMFVFANGELMPAFTFLPSKDDTRDEFYWDGFQAEWRFNEPFQEMSEFLREMETKLMDFRGRCRAANPTAKLSLKNVVRVPDSILLRSRQEHVALGCEPSENIYGLKGEPIYNPRDLKYRFAGGHMHFGFGKRTVPYEAVVKTLDAILGVWSVGAAANFDDPIRRRYYGLAGEHRRPRYSDKTKGVEYRVLSNFWLASPETMCRTWAIGLKCVQLAFSAHRNAWAATEQETVETINHCDVGRARSILERNRPMFNWLMGNESDVLPGLHGIEFIVRDPQAIEANWGIA